MTWLWVGVVVLVVLSAGMAGAWQGRRGGDSARAIPRWLKWGTVIGFGAAVGIALLGLWLGRAGNSELPSGAKPASLNTAVVVPVKTARLRLSTIEETITVYGTVIAQLGETQLISVPFESRVGRIFVTAGEQVRAHTSLLEIGPSAASRLQLQQAQDVNSAARKELQQVQEQYDQRLATNSQILAAKQSFQAAQRTLNALENQGVGRSTILTAQSAGIIRVVSVRQGQIVPAGAALVENAVESRIEVKLGIEPEDVPYVHVNSTVELSPVHTDAAPTIGHVRLITRQVNPATRLVDVFVSLPPQSALMLEGYVRGKIVTAAKRTLVAPRNAVLPDQNGSALFTVDNGYAVKHLVHVGLESSTEVEVEGDGLKEGKSVVVTGNYELTSGMAVSQVTTP